MGCVKERLLEAFGNESFTLQEAYNVIFDKPKTTVRGRIYDNLGIAFKKIKKGVYCAASTDERCVVIEGDGRKLDFLDSASVDCIITDHPWYDKKSNKGGNRNFANYACLEYTQEDFNEKARVLKDGCFLVEMIPAENEANYEYLYKIKQMAKNAGFEYYAKVPWKKGSFVSNTGRKAKNTEEMMFFTKGKARMLRPDAKKDKADPSVQHFMSGANGMLPTCFDVQPPKEKLHQSEKPVGLIEQIIHYITKPDELIVDQFAGSGSTGEAALKTKRRCILVEQDHAYIEKITQRLALKPVMM